jgi:hypothetical protein
MYICKKVEFLSKKKISLSADVLAISDSTNPKKVLYFDTNNGKLMNYSLEHSLEILHFELN